MGYSVPIVNVQFKSIRYIIPTFEVTQWSGFTNQPNNDDIQVVSDNVGDTGKITLWGVDSNDELVYHTITLNGTTAVDSVLAPKWKTLYGAFMGDAYGNNVKAAVGTITIREKSGEQTIATIAATKISVGLVGFVLPGCNVSVYKVSGNLWINTKEVVTEANGYPADSKNELRVTDKVFLISDGSGATAKIIVWDD